MNTIYRSGKLKISVYADHAPPHFHVRTPEGDSTVDLQSLTVTAGGVSIADVLSLLPPPQAASAQLMMRMAMRFMSKHPQGCPAQVPSV